MSMDAQDSAAQQEPCIAICRGTGVRYQARARYEGYRRYTLLGMPSKSYKVALRRLAEAFGTNHYKRADVVMYADYYDAVQLCELVRR